MVIEPTRGENDLAFFSLPITLKVSPGRADRQIVVATVNVKHLNPKLIIKHHATSHCLGKQTGQTFMKLV